MSTGYIAEQFIFSIEFRNCYIIYFADCVGFGISVVLEYTCI